MLYCEKCKILCPDNGSGSVKCPNKPKHVLREVKDDDPVYLTSKNSVWAGLMGNVLDDNGIPYLRKGQLGAGLVAAVGEVMESYSYYVMYRDLARANEIVNELFSSDNSEDDKNL